MKGYEQTCPEVEAIGQINFHGDGIYTPNNWYHNICRANGKPYIEAIILLADIVSWYLPIYERDEVTGKTVATRKKFKADKLQRNYDSFADHYGMTKDQARNALKHLEKDGLISLELRTVETAIQKLGNVLFVGVHPEKIKKYTFTLPENEQTPIPTETDRGTDRKPEGSAQEQTGLPSETQTNTDQSTDPSTDQSTKEKRADDFFANSPLTQNQESHPPAQTQNPNIQDPQTPKPLSPATPENKPKPAICDRMAERFANKGPSRKQVTEPLTRDDSFLRYLFTRLKTKPYYKDLVDKDDLEPIRVFIRKSWFLGAEGDARFAEMENYIKDYEKHKAAEAIASQQAPVPTDIPQQTAPRIDPIAHKRMIEEARRRVAQQAA